MIFIVFHTIKSAFPQQDLDNKTQSIHGGRNTVGAFPTGRERAVNEDSEIGHRPCI